MKLEDMKVYELSMDIGERVWSIVNKWSYFEKDTIGKMLNNYINSIGKYKTKETNQVNEPEIESYSFEDDIFNDI